MLHLSMSQKMVRVQIPLGVNGSYSGKHRGRKSREKAGMTGPECSSRIFQPQAHEYLGRFKASKQVSQIQWQRTNPVAGLGLLGGGFPSETCSWLGSWLPGPRCRCKGRLWGCLGHPVEAVSGRFSKPLKETQRPTSDPNRCFSGRDLAQRSGPGKWFAVFELLGHWATSMSWSWMVNWGVEGLP